MSETVKYRKFCSEPMGEKPLAIVPGVGIVLARKLRGMKFIKAKDLYNQLQRLNYDEKKFRVWIHINCKGAKVAIIYKALMDWHQQFGGEQSDADESVSSEASELGSSRGWPFGAARPRNSVQFDLSRTAPARGAASPGTDKRPRNSVHFNLPRADRGDSLQDDIPHSNNPLQLFFASFSDSCLNILPEYHTELKMEISNIVYKFEKKSKETQSTSFATNGA